MTLWPKLFAASALLSSAPILAEETPLSLQTSVPRVCYVAPTGPIETGTGFVQFAGVTEFCNSGGYSVVLEYTPGTMMGAIASFAGQRVVLDGSGQAVLLDADYAVSRISTLVIEQPGIEQARTRVQLRMAAR